MSEREQLLERLLAGELDADDPVAQRLFERDPSAREEFAALHALERSLGRQGDRTRALLDDAMRGRVPGEAATVRRELDRMAGVSSTPTAGERRGPHRWVAALAAAALAAAALVVIAWIVGTDEASPREELTLSEPTSDDVRPLAPLGEVSAYATFRWTGELQAGGWFEVEVYDAGAPPGSEPILRSGTLLEAQWTPSNPPPAWPEEIRWLVFTFDSSGHGRTSEAFSASLSP